MKLIQCADCELTKPATSFGWNTRLKARNVYCRACGCKRKLKQSFRAPAHSAWYRKSNLSMSILGK